MKLNLDKSDLLKEDLKISYDKLLDRRNQLLTVSPHSHKNIFLCIYPDLRRDEYIDRHQHQNCL